jgi:hypothetical protein
LLSDREKIVDERRYVFRGKRRTGGWPIPKNSYKPFRKVPYNPEAGRANALDYHKPHYFEKIIKQLGIIGIRNQSFIKFIASMIIYRLRHYFIASVTFSWKLEIFSSELEWAKDKRRRT